MNIFYLHNEPKKCAEFMVDKHIVKMILETAQLLCSVFENNTAPYKRTHYNHPSAKWTRYSKENYLWLIEHGKALNEEYKFRYNKISNHKSYEVILWCENNINKIQFESNGFVDVFQAMTQEFKSDNSILSYQNYYKNNKKNIAKWTKRDPPKWMIYTN